MNIQGWAFKENELELRDENLVRYNEIKHLAKDLELRKSSQYGKNVFSGKLNSEEAKELSSFDLALIADGGNLCFGGSCTKGSDSFTGCYYTD